MPARRDDAMTRALRTLAKKDPAAYASLRALVLALDQALPKRGIEFPKKPLTGKVAPSRNHARRRSR